MQVTCINSKTVTKLPQQIGNSSEKTLRGFYTHTEELAHRGLYTSVWVQFP